MDFFWCVNVLQDASFAPRVQDRRMRVMVAWRLGAGLLSGSTPPCRVLARGGDFVGREA